MTILQYCTRLTLLPDKHVKANIVFLKKIIDCSINTPSELAQINFKIPANGRNLPIGHIMGLGNDLFLLSAS